LTTAGALHVRVVALKLADHSVVMFAVYSSQATRALPAASMASGTVAHAAAALKMRAGADQVTPPSVECEPHRPRSATVGVDS
jgi:hypothetical protein